MQSKKKFFNSVWFKILLVLLFFIPSYTQTAYDPADTTKVITSVLSNPLIVNFAFVLPIAKIILLAAVVAILANVKKSSLYFMGYYALVLVVVGVFQNMSKTNEYGFVWLIGNTLVMFIISVFCISDALSAKSSFDKKYFTPKRLWIVAPMLVAFLMPYAINEQGIIAPTLSLSILVNEAGVTYCMITPVIIGTMILFSKGVHRPTLSIISFIGLGFGIMNMLTWFVFQYQNWWMGVLHLPLLVLSFYASLLCKNEKADTQ